MPENKTGISPQPSHSVGVGAEIAKKKHHSPWYWLGALFSVCLIALAAYSLTVTLSQIDYGQLRAAFRKIRSEQMLAALGFSTLSYLALTGYDAIALRQLKLKIRYRLTAMASFCAYAISFVLGFPLITGGTVRYWIYSGAGMNAEQVARLTLVAGVTFWLGMALLIAVALMMRPEAISAIDHLSAGTNWVIGALGLIALIVYLIYVSLAPRRYHVGRFTLELPGFWLTSGQIFLGVADLSCAAATLYVLLPPIEGLDFISFIALYVGAVLIGIASHVPGGGGVFEATILSAINAPKVELLASLALFRVAYYLIPALLALALLGAHEANRRWSDLRQAMFPPSDD